MDTLHDELLSQVLSRLPAAYLSRFFAACPATWKNKVLKCGTVAEYLRVRHGSSMAEELVAEIGPEDAPWSSLVALEVRMGSGPPRTRAWGGGNDFPRVACACGYNWAAMVAPSGHAYAFGRMDEGRLGLTSSDVERLPRHMRSHDSQVVTVPAPLNVRDRSTPKGMRKNELLFWSSKSPRGARETKSEGATFRAVAAGDEHMLLVTTNGSVEACGNGLCGRLGVKMESLEEMSEDMDTSELGPLPTLLKIPIAQVSAGQDHSLFLGVSGAAFSVGLNTCGQLGIGPPGEGFGVVPLGPQDMSHVTVPTPVAAHLRFASVSAGYEFSVWVSAEGHAYSCGRARSGRLGLSAQSLGLISSLVAHWRTVNPVWSPRRLENMQHVIQASAGQTHTLLLTSEGEVHSCGDGGFGQLGYEYNGLPDAVGGGYAGSNWFNPLPSHVLMPEPVVKVACGLAHSVLLTESGSAFACGFNEDGRLGLGAEYQGQIVPHTAHVFVPSRIDLAFLRGLLLPGLEPQGDEVVIDMAAGGEHLLLVTQTRSPGGDLTRRLRWYATMADCQFSDFIACGPEDCVAQQDEPEQSASVLWHPGGPLGLC